MSALKVQIQPLQENDIQNIMAIEKASFKNHWPESAFMEEIQKNRLAYYLVARHEGELVGYAGLWLVLNEAHITTVAVQSSYRRRKIGEQLVHSLLLLGISKGAEWATLEVRESNEAAQNLYKKFGFVSTGIRKNYYAEENENAVVMWAGNLREESFQKKLSSLSQALEKEVLKNG